MKRAKLQWIQERFFQCLILSLFMWPAVGLAFTETFYVSQGGNGSQPTNPRCGETGTCWAPRHVNDRSNWGSVDRKDRKIGPNDLVILLNDGGVMTPNTDGYGVLRIMQSGLPGKPITIRGEAGQTPLIDGRKTRRGIFNANRNHIVISNVQVANGAPFGIEVWDSDNVTILDSYVHHATKANIIYSGENGLISRCRLSYSSAEHGIYFCEGFTKNCTIEYSYIHDNLKSGVQLNSNSERQPGMTIRYNWIENSGEQDINELGGDGAEIYGNVITSTKKVAYHAIFLGSDGVGLPPRNALVYNNTIYGRYGGAISIDNSSTGNEIINNIVYNKEPSRALVSVSKDSTGFFDNNVWYHEGSASSWNYQGRWSNTLQGWQASLGGCSGDGNDCSAKFQNPGLADPPNGVFALKSGSVCIDRARDTIGPEYGFMLAPTVRKSHFGPFKSIKLLDQSNYGSDSDIGALVYVP